jgi:hypothetical protein
VDVRVLRAIAPGFLTTLDDRNGANRRIFHRMKTLVLNSVAGGLDLDAPKSGSPSRVVTPSV